jgi:hypothetical protein
MNQTVCSAKAPTEVIQEMKMKQVLIGLLVIALCGCATAPKTLWVKPGGTQEDFALDRYECAQQSQTSWSGGGTGLMGVAVMAGAQADAQNRATAMFKIEFKPAYQGIAQHIPLNSDKKGPTLEQLTDTGTPSDEDVQAIIAMHKDKTACREQVLEFNKEFNPGTVPMMLQAYDAADLITADLIQRKITWGEYNKKITALKDDFRSKLQGSKK